MTNYNREITELNRIIAHYEFLTDHSKPTDKNSFNYAIYCLWREILRDCKNRRNNLKQITE